MAKKFFGLLGIFVCVLFSAVGFAACSKPVTIKGTVNIEFDGFTMDDVGNGDLYFNGSSSVGGSSDSADALWQYTYGPEKTESKSGITIEITVSKRYNVALVIREKDNKPFTTTTRNNYDNNSFIITIPFAKEIDYNFVLSKPVAQVYEVQFEVGNTPDLNSTNPIVRDFLDHTEVWVDNAAYNAGNNQYTGGFLPLLTGEDGDKQFGLWGKFVSVNMAEEFFSLYLKYDNDGRDMPFTLGFLRDVFNIDTSSAEEIEVDELLGERVYALKFDTSEVEADSILRLTDGLNNLSYMASRLQDNETKDVSLSDSGPDNISLSFNLIGWKLGDAQEWETTTLPYYKEYGQKLTIRYQFDMLDGPTSEVAVLQGLIDFARIKFLINGAAVKNLQFDPDEMTYTFEIGEYDTPETYAGELAQGFNISVDRASVGVREDITSIEEVNFSSQLYFHRGDYNITLSYLVGQDATTHARVYVGEPPEGGFNLMQFRLRDLGRFESFTIEITINGKTYTKQFVRGVDFLVDLTGDGQLAGAYFVGSQGSSEILYLGDDHVVSYHTYLLSADNELIFELPSYREGAVVQAQLKDVQLREIEVVAEGDVYDGELAVQDVTNYDGTYKTDKLSVEFELNKEYDNGANCEVIVEVYSNDVLLLTYSGQEDSILGIDGYEMIGGSFYWYVGAYSSEPDIVLEFYSNGVLAIRQGGASEVQVVITKIVVTFQSKNG